MQQKTNSLLYILNFILVKHKILNEWGCEVYTRLLTPFTDIEIE